MLERELQGKAKLHDATVVFRRCYDIVKRTMKTAPIVATATPVSFDETSPAVQALAVAVQALVAKSAMSATPNRNQ